MYLLKLRNFFNDFSFGFSSDNNINYNLIQNVNKYDNIKISNHSILKRDDVTDCNVVTLQYFLCSRLNPCKLNLLNFRGGLVVWWFLRILLIYQYCNNVIQYCKSWPSNGGSSHEA